MKARASHPKAALVGEMSIERVTLNTGPLRHHAEGRVCGTHTAVQVDGRLDDSPARVRLPLRAPFQGVGPAHDDFVTLSCALIVDKLEIITTHDGAMN
jgi:hypothetical protein